MYFLPNSSIAHSLCYKLWSQQPRHAYLSSLCTGCSLSLESFLPGYSHYSLPWFPQVLAQLWTLSEASHISLCKVLNTLFWPWHSRFPISSSISFHSIHHNLTYHILYLLMFTVCLPTRKKTQETKDNCLFYSLMYLSVQFSRSVMFDSLRPHESQHARPPYPSPTPGVHSDSCPSSQWCHRAISSSAVPFSSFPQSLPASESFPMSQLFAWGGQSTGVSVLASFLPKKSQGRSPSEWTGWISLQSKGLLRVFSNTTVQKHQFFGAQLSSQSNSHVHTWLLEKP